MPAQILTEIVRPLLLVRLTEIAFVRLQRTYVLKNATIRPASTADKMWICVRLRALDLGHLQRGLMT